MHLQTQNYRQTHSKQHRTIPCPKRIPSTKIIPQALLQKDAVRVKQIPAANQPNLKNNRQKRLFLKIRVRPVKTNIKTITQ